MRMGIGLRALAMAVLAAASARAQESITLTGVARDFAELKEGDSTGGHPDFNPNVDPATGRENWACFDKPSAAKGAVENRPVSADANPDKLPGLVPYDRDEVGPAHKIPRQRSECTSKPRPRPGGQPAWRGTGMTE